MESLTINAEVRNLGLVNNFVLSRLENCGCSDHRTLMQIRLAVEEIFVNISSYAYDPSVGPAENRAMVSAIKKYINGGTNVAGGKTKAPHFKEAMCVLKEYMPAHEFSAYCEEINRAHPKRTVSPSSFTPERMQSKVKTAAEIRQEAKRQLRVGFSEDACAAVMAARLLSKGDRNALITPEALEETKAKLFKGGSAFSRAMSNEKDREVFRQMARDGKMAALGKEIEKRSNSHTIGAAQYQINRSINTLTSGGPLNRYFTSEHLATIYASHELASRAGPGAKIDKDALNDAKEQLQSDPNFKKMVDRYISDPEYKNRINKDLTLDGTGSILALEMHKLRNPQAQRPARQNADARPEQQRERGDEQQLQPRPAP